MLFGLENTKTRVTLEKLVIYFHNKFYKKKIKTSEIKSSIRFDCPIFLCEFDLFRLPNSVELNTSIEFDLV